MTVSELRKGDFGPKATEAAFDTDVNKNLADVLPFLDPSIETIDLLLFTELGLLCLAFIVAGILFIRYRPHFREKKSTI